MKDVAIIIYKFLRDCTDEQHKVDVYNLMLMLNYKHQIYYSRKSMHDTLNAIEAVDSRLKVSRSRGRKSLYWYER